jgi:phosphotriesterase-related protein
MNLGYVRTWPRGLADNTVLDDFDAALDDLRTYAVAGGRTIVELTPCAMGRDLERLQWFSRSANVNVIASTAYYVYRAHKGLVAGRSVADIAAEFVRDLTEGVVRCGVIGEKGVSGEPYDDELNVVQAGLEAQAATGAPMFIHVTTIRPVPTLLDILDKSGRLLNRVVRGGFGYAHILTRVVPLLKTLGASDELIHQMGVESPARLLCWA